MRRGNTSLACAVSKLRFRAFPGLGDRSPWRREVQGVGKREVPGDCDSYADGNSFPDSCQPRGQAQRTEPAGRSWAGAALGSHREAVGGVSREQGMRRKRRLSDESSDGRGLTVSGKGRAARVPDSHENFKILKNSKLPFT